MQNCHWFWIPQLENQKQSGPYYIHSNLSRFFLLFYYTLRSAGFLSFQLGYPKSVTVLHRNQHPQRKFWYLVKRSNGVPTKIGHFQSFVVNICCEKKSDLDLNSKIGIKFQENSFVQHTSCFMNSWLVKLTKEPDQSSVILRYISFSKCHIKCKTRPLISDIAKRKL